jgi:hypothetical protein
MDKWRTMNLRRALLDWMEVFWKSEEWTFVVLREAASDELALKETFAART